MHVGVSEKGDRNWKGEERLHSIGGRDQVFVFINGGAVNKLHVRQFWNLNRTLRELTQPFQILGGQLIPGPQRCHTGERIELAQVDEPSRGFIVISPNQVSAQFSCPLNGLIRIRSVSDNVTQVDHRIIRRHRSETRLQRFDITVDIAEYQDPHMPPDGLPIIALSMLAGTKLAILFRFSECVPEAATGDLVVEIWSRMSIGSGLWLMNGWNSPLDTWPSVPC